MLRGRKDFPHGAPHISALSQKRKIDRLWDDIKRFFYLTFSI
jgi:hypothetical protein